MLLMSSLSLIQMISIHNPALMLKYKRLQRQAFERSSRFSLNLCCHYYYYYYYYYYLPCVYRHLRSATIYLAYTDTYALPLFTLRTPTPTLCHYLPCVHRHLRAAAIYLMYTDTFYDSIFLLLVWSIINLIALLLRICICF